MRARKRQLLWLLLLPAALPLIPALAGGAEGTPTVEAKDEPGSGAYAEEHHSWSPVQTIVSAGSAVTFTNPSSTVPHGIEWISPPSTPTCSGVPLSGAAESSGTHWSGTCTFSQNGLYRFYCTVHGAAMQGRVVVQNGIITTSTTTTQSSSTSTTTTTSGTPTPEAPLGPLLVGSATKALRLAASQHGKQVRGSLDLAPGGAGSRLEVELLASKAVLAKSGHAAQTRVGKLVRSLLKSGEVSFKVPLSVKAKRALHKRRRLALTVKLVLTPKQGAAVTLTRHIVLHA